MLSLLIDLKHCVSIKSFFKKESQNKFFIAAVRVVDKNFPNASRLIRINHEKRNFYIILWRFVEKNIIQISLSEFYTVQ